MKKLLLSALLVGSFAANAGEVTFNFAEPTTLTPTVNQDQTQDDGAVYAEISGVTFTSGPISFTTTSAEGKTTPKIWTTAKGVTTYRCYTGSTLNFTTSEQVVRKVVLNCNNTNLKKENVSLSAGVLTVEGKTATWEGNAPDLKIEITGGSTIQVNNFVVTYGEPGDEPVPDTPDQPGDVVFQETFASSQGDFTIENVTMPSELDYVWTWTSSYGMKASAYLQGKAYTTDSYLISPVIDLSSVGEATLSFDQAVNFFADIETAKKEATLYARVPDGQWQSITIPNYPSSLSWDFITSGDIKLDNYVGKKVQFAFRYTSTDAKAGTWEIKNFLIKGNGSVTPPEPPATGEGDKVITFNSLGSQTITLKDVYEEGYFEIDGITFGFEKGEGKTDPAYNKAGDVRFYANNTVTIGAGEDMSQLEFNISAAGLKRLAHITCSTGEIVEQGANPLVWRGTAKSVAFTVGETSDYGTEPDKAGQFDFDKVTIYFGTSGIAGIADHNGAPVFYNLQGQRVAQPTHGLYIMRQGDKASKVRF